MLKVALEQFEDFVKDKVEVKHCTYKQISDRFTEAFPGERGFSLRSVERFCNQKGIRKTSEINDQELDIVINEAVSQVANYYIKCHACRLKSRSIIDAISLACYDHSCRLTQYGQPCKYGYFCSYILTDKGLVRGFM